MSELHKISRKVQEWRKAYLFLPKLFRDFHAQKDLFKSIHEHMDTSKALPQGETVNWITAQCYVVDVFLWFMARHGYTLQKSRTKLDFNDLETTLKECEDLRNKRFADMLNNHIKDNKQ